MENRRSWSIDRRQFLRYIGIGATGALATSGLIGCVPSAMPVAPTQPPPAPAAKATEEVVSLRYQTHWGSDADAHKSAMEWVYKTFRDRNPNIKLDVNMLPQSDESTKKITADCAAGDCPDIVHEVYLDYYDAGWLLDLAPYIDADWKARLIPEVAEENSWDGHVFGVSVEYSPMSSIWNMATLDQVGMPIPKTWADYLALGDALKSKGMYLTSFNMGTGLHGFTALVFGQDGAAQAMAKNDWKNDAVLFAFTRLKELVDNQFIPSNELEVKWRQIVPLFQTGKMAMYPNGAWHIRNAITAEGADPELRNHVAFSPFPSPGTTRPIQVMNATAIGLAASLEKQPARLKAAVELLKFWTSDEAAQVFITQAQSPLGVKAEIPGDKVPLLAAFMDATKQADSVFSLPASKRLRARAWDHPEPGIQTLLMGKSAEEATDAYAAEMSKT